MQHCDSDGQMMLFSLEEADEIYARPPKRKSGTLTLSTLISIPYFHLDLSKGHVDLFGCHYWEFRSPWQENGPPLNTGAAPREPVKCDLSSILERDPDERHDLSPKACLGILRRAKERGKPLPERLEWALMAQAGLLPMNFQAAEMRAYHINRRDEDTNLYGVAGTLMATSNMQMQTFINGDSVVFAANQREKVNCRKAAREAALGRARQKNSSHSANVRAYSACAAAECNLSQKRGTQFSTASLFFEYFFTAPCAPCRASGSAGSRPAEPRTPSAPP